MLEVAHIYLLRQGQNAQEKVVLEDDKQILSPSRYPFVPFLLGLVFILLALQASAKFGGLAGDA